MYALQSTAATLLAMPILHPPRVSRGAAGLTAEARRLQRLKLRGWPVPDVVDVTDRWLAITDLGVSLQGIVCALSPSERSKVLRDGLKFMQDLHREGGWHGGARLGNVTLGASSYGFIDLEDDIEPSMPLALRQTRDVLLFIIGSARYAADDASLVPSLISDAHRSALPAVAAELGAVGVKLARATRLSGGLLQRLGREGLAFARIGEAYRRA